ncbi:scavenger receptor class B member 1-like [Aricia agestis]|uniref:scavenger receptor class B member 1-like n=1 Tax=Aricia agestis TaxID=91739 RepID=UPI001C2021FC|nr:scavenger receptor class B member 1-like [Aricia agestis]
MEQGAPLMGAGERVVIVAPAAAGKILIREDTIMNNLQGCAGCGRAQFTCAGVRRQWSGLCWGQTLTKRYYCFVVALSALFSVSLIAAVFLLFTNSFNDAILSSMALRNNSLAYSMWRRPTVTPTMRVHLFNYTNWEAVRDGREDKLHVQEVGPYAYSQHVERVNTKFDGEQLTYQESNRFRFLPHKSAGSPFDHVNVPNLPLLAAISRAVHYPLLMQMGLASSLNLVNHKEAFLQLPVERFLWGYEDSIYDTAKTFLSINGQLKYKNFGLLVAKNGTSSDVFTINTGAADKDKMNILERFNGVTSLDMWGTAECNSIYSTDGSIFPPSILDRNQSLYVFYANLCRRFPFHYTEDVEIADGIKLLRYSLPDNVFDDKEHNPANQCYCELDSGACPPRGVINVTACTQGFPAFASFPHFHLGDPALRSQLSGLRPDARPNYLDVHPTLGIALRGKSSLQLNVQVKKGAVFGALRYLPQDIILPVAWIEMSVEDLPESLQSLVYHGTYSTAAARLGLSVFAVLALVLSAACLALLVAGRRRKPCAVVKVPVDTKPES